MGPTCSERKKGGKNALDDRRAASGDSASPQSNGRFTQRQRLCRHAGPSVEPMESITRSPNWHGVFGDRPVNTRALVGQWQLDLVGLERKLKNELDGRPQILSSENGGRRFRYPPWLQRPTLQQEC